MDNQIVLFYKKNHYRVGKVKKKEKKKDCYCVLVDES